MSHSQTRHSLIVRLKDRQNDAAWEEFVVNYESFLNRMVVRQGVPQQHVADVVQQILFAIARSIDGWNPDGQQASFRRWLSTVARNVVIRFMTRERRQIRGHGGSDVMELLQHVEGQPDEQQIQKYEHEFIVWAAEQVRAEFIETSWTAFWQTVIEGRTVNDVAHELNISPGSIYMSRSRIMARIRKIVEKVME